jgi:signal transduction histidine kinase
VSAEVVLFCGDIEFLSAEKLINAKFSIEPKLSVHGDWIMLGQIIQNLSGNALKYNEESGRQWCVIKEESGEAIFEVGNSGPGIPDGESDRIFDRFYRADRARFRKVDGVGLGLNIALKIALEIVRAHRGDLILVQSNGDATVFQMRSPLV